MVWEEWESKHAEMEKTTFQRRIFSANTTLFVTISGGMEQKRRCLRWDGADPSSGQLFCIRPFGFWSGTGRSRSVQGRLHSHWRALGCLRCLNERTINITSLFIVVSMNVSKLMCCHFTTLKPKQWLWISNIFFSNLMICPVFGPLNYGCRRCFLMRKWNSVHIRRFVHIWCVLSANFKSLCLLCCEVESMFGVEVGNLRLFRPPSSFWNIINENFVKMYFIWDCLFLKQTWRTDDSLRCCVKMKVTAYSPDVQMLCGEVQEQKSH